MSGDFCIRCDNALGVYCGQCVDAIREERDEARANYAFMVERAADEKLDGYRDWHLVMVRRFNEQLARANEATTKLKFIETEYERANASELTRDALALQNAALVARCETLRQLADCAAAEQGLANRRMMQAQAERDQLREELARLHRLAPIGTYTVSLPHEQEIQRLSGEKYTWQARAELAEEAANGLREALRAAEKRELQSLAELNEREADVETLQTHVEVQREALQKTSKAVAKLVVPMTKIEELLEENGCDCECDHCWEDHDEDCERCLACLIDAAICDKKEGEP